MKQKFLLSLTLLCMSLCSASTWAELVRPTMPEATLEPGKSYYLYNVEADLFAKYSNGFLVNEKPSAIEITQDDGDYKMKTEGYYLGRGNSNGGVSRGSSYSRSSYAWSIIEADDSYLIRHYSSEQYLGWLGNNATEIRHNQDITGAVHWKLIPADAEGDRYVAALMLYKELKKTETFIENGYDKDLFKYYTDLYASRTTADINEMTDAAIKLRGALSVSQGYKAPYWNEYPMIWECAEGSFGTTKTWELTSKNVGFAGSFTNIRTQGSISVTVKVDQLSTIVYTAEHGSAKRSSKCFVYVDGVLVRELTEKQSGHFFEELSAGTHKITWVASLKADQNSFSVLNVGIMKSPLITACLLEPGSLGTEVLYNTDHIKNVRRLKIIGKMNDDDWAKIKMMHYLQDLDLTEAIITEIPKRQFSTEADSSSNFLHKMKLPEGLTKINEEAFKGSRIDSLFFPSTLTTIGSSAFQASHVKEIILPESCVNTFAKSSSAYSGSFYAMKWLERVVLPKTIKKIGARAFYNCSALKEVVLPEELDVVEDDAFYGCQEMTATLPEKLKEIGVRAFESCNRLETVTLKNLETLGYDAFRYCASLKEVEIGQFCSYLGDASFANCSRLETLRLNCANVVLYNNDRYYYPVNVENIQNVRLVVPEHLVTSYKLDSYWYNFKSVEGFRTTEIQDWVVFRPLTLNRERLEGTPNLSVKGNVNSMNYLKINGDATQRFNNLYLLNSSSAYNSYAGQILSNCNNVVINGKVNVDLATKDKYWHFFCLPYDVKVSDITSGDTTAQRAIRYYDGANRAQIGAVGSWKNFEADAVIPAGTGFIMQTNKSTYSTFPSFNETKQNIVATTEFVKTMEENHSDTPSNNGWNLVGNPWQCFYNSHALNFTAPITVWDTQNRTYKAYSITDDDYAIRPNEAFFVQCPDAGNNTIGFPAQGRQLNAIIESQNAVKEFGTTVAKRRLIDIAITGGESEDNTRIVLNEEASLSYEMTCDAGKMMSMEATVPQIYSLGENGTRYAINERPMDEGLVMLGFHAGTSGEYTIALNRCQAERVFLTDYETGETTELTVGDYTFTAEAGDNDVRFAISFAANDETDIATIQEKAENAAPKVYTIDGKYAGNGIESLQSGVYVVRQGAKAGKVIVK